MKCVIFGADAPDLDLPAADNFIADSADAFFVERIPAPMIIYCAKDFESILRVQKFLHCE